LGQVLIQKGFIKPEDLRHSLQLQVSEIIYRLFRWIDGEYHFSPQDVVEYDQENFTPIGSESILMQGVRMLDEWPMIERVLPNFEVHVERTERGKNVELSMDRRLSIDPNLAESFDSLLEDVMTESKDQDPGEEGERLDLPHEQELVLRMIDGPTQVQDLIDRSGLNEFETCRTIYDLIEIGLVRRSAGDHLPVPGADDVERRTVPFVIPGLLIAALALISVFVGWNPLNRTAPSPLQFPQRAGVFEDVTLYRLQTIGDAIERYYFRNRAFPDSLSQMKRLGMLGERDIRDPMNRAYEYEVAFDQESVVVRGRDRDGRISDRFVFQMNVSRSDAGQPGLE
jgi:hypothetical protein